MSGKLSEVELGQILVPWLREEGWTVYQEVQCGRSEAIADVVATSGPIVWVLEIKRVLGLDVIAQASNWLGRAHRISVVVPRFMSSRSGSIRARDFARQVLRWKGLGLIEICQWTGGTAEVRDQSPAPLHRRADVELILARLHPEQQDFAPAGNADGRRFVWSPFRQTCREVTRAVQRTPGIAMKVLVDGIEHHYASDKGARAHLATWIRANKVPGVMLRQDGRKLTLWPEEKADG